MTLQNQINELKSEIEAARGQEYNLYLDPEKVLRVCRAADIMQSELKNIAHGENRPGQHRQWAQYAFRKADAICAEGVG